MWEHNSFTEMSVCALFVIFILNTALNIVLILSKNPPKNLNCDTTMKKFKTLNIKTTTTNTHCAATMRNCTCETVCADLIFFHGSSRYYRCYPKVRIVKTWTVISINNGAISIVLEITSAYCARSWIVYIEYSVHNKNVKFGTYSIYRY